MKRRKICILAPVHPYYDVRVFQKEACSLTAAGYQVILMAKADSRRVEAGVEVLPVSHRSRLERFAKQPLFLYRALATGADAYHLHNPDTIPIGLALKVLGRRVVYDSHENFRNLIPTKSWLPRPLRRPTAHLVDGLERIASKVFDRIIVTQFDQVEKFGERAVLIENPPISQGTLIDEALEKAQVLPRGDCFRVVYPGLLSEARGLLVMVDAMEHLNRQVSARLWLMGPEGDRDIIKKAQRQAGWQYVDYLGRISQVDAFAYVSAADVGVIVFLPEGDNQELNPNKLFEYLRFGTPFLASDFPVWRGYLKDVKAGLWVDPTDSHAVAETLRWFADHPQIAARLGSAGQEFVLSEYNWESESRKLLAIYDGLFL